MPATDTDADPSGPTASRRLLFTSGTLFLAWVIAYIDRTIITLLVPGMKSDLGLTDTEVGVLQGFAFALFFSLAGLPIGRLVDRSNRRNIIVIGLVLWSFATMSCCLATDFWHLFWSRVGVGVGEACLAPASMSLIVDMVRPEQRGRATTFIASGAPVGAASGNYIAGFLLASLTGASLVLPYFGRIHVWGIVLLVVGALGLLIVPLLLMIREPLRRHASADQTHVAQPFRYLLGKWRLFLPLYLCIALNLVTTAAVAIWGPILLMRDYGLSPSQTGVIIGTIMMIGGPVASVAAGYFSDAVLSRRPDDGRMLLFTSTSLPMVAVLLLFTGPKILALTITGLLGVKLVSNAMFGMGYATVQESVPGSMRGLAVAIYVALSNIVGLSFGALLVGLATDYVFGDEAMIRPALALVTLPATSLAFLFGMLAVRPYARERSGLRGAERRFGLAA